MTHRFLPHTADVLVELEAATLGELLEEATEVTRRLLVGRTAVASTHGTAVRLTASSADELLHHYVRELLAEFQLHGFVPARLEAREVSPTRLDGLVFGEQFDERKHETQPEVKAVTRHELRVEQTASGWLATMVLDL
jgi:SHS2 domain-containing protein